MIGETPSHYCRTGRPLNQAVHVSMRVLLCPPPHTPTHNDTPSSTPPLHEWVWDASGCAHCTFPQHLGGRFPCIAWYSQVQPKAKAQQSTSLDATRTRPQPQLSCARSGCTTPTTSGPPNPPPSSSSLSTTTAKASNPQQQAFGCAQGAQLQNMQTSIAHNSTDIHGIPENKLNDLANLRPEEQDYVSMYGAHVGPMPLPCGLPPPSVPCIRAISGTTANPPTNCTI